MADFSRRSKITSATIILFLFATVQCGFAEKVTSGKIGAPVTLTCNSHSDEDIFVFWETPLGVVAPGYNISRSKYKYDVLTGDISIFIQGTEEVGKYSCYSRDTSNGMIHASNVVQLSIEESVKMAGSEFLSTLYRCIVLMSVAIIVLAGWIAHMLWSRFTRKTDLGDGQMNLLDMDQLESLDGDVELTQLSP